MSRNVSIALGALMIVATGVLTYLQTRPAPAPAASSGAASGAYTSAQVASHANGSSCWTIIDGSVYDLTAWIPEHPGGSQAILQLCGTDGSGKFNGMHGGKEPMMTILAGFKIGTLSQ